MMSGCLRWLPAAENMTEVKKMGTQLNSAPSIGTAPGGNAG